jgi:hypothetical protein
MAGLLGVQMRPAHDIAARVVDAAASMTDQPPR